MRGNDFLDKMELVDAAYIEAADNLPQKRETEVYPMHRKTRKVSRTALIAAVLAIMLMGSAFAVWGIHSARQQELKEDLQIDAEKWKESKHSQDRNRQRACLLHLGNDDGELRMRCHSCPSVSRLLRTADAATALTLPERCDSG